MIREIVETRGDIFLKLNLPRSINRYQSPWKTNYWRKRPREKGDISIPICPLSGASFCWHTNFCWRTSRCNSNGLSPVKRSKKKLTWMVTGIGHDRCLNASRFLPIPLIPGHAVSRVRPLQPETSSTLYMTSGSNRIIHCPGRMTWTSDLQREECQKYSVPPGAEIFKNVVPICKRY